VSGVVPAAIAAGASVALLVAGLARLASSRTGDGAAASPARRPAGPRTIGSLPAGRRLGERLARAGVPLGPDAFVGLVAAAAIGAAALAAAAARTPLAIPVAVAAVVGAAASVVRSADGRYLARVTAQLPGVAQQLAAALQAGLSLRQALARAARDAPEPCRRELSRAVEELALGSRLESALEGLVSRAPAHDLRIMVTAILVQRRTGGNLARALSGLAARLEERAQLARELRGATAQARMTAWLVAALPLGAAVMAEMAAPGTLSRVLGEGPGPPLLAVSALLYGCGVLWIRRIGRVEP
jgi:tight adherence protein B